MTIHDRSSARDGAPVVGELGAPVALVLGSMVSLQLGAAVASHLFDDVGAAGASAMRLGFAAVLLMAWTRPKVRAWAGSRRRTVVQLGVAMAVMNSAFYVAVDRLPLGAAITIEFLGPLGLAVVLTRRWREALWVALAVAGVALLGLGQHGGVGASLDPVGVAAALVAGACWAAYIVVGSRLATTDPGVAGLAVASTVAALLVVPVGIGAAGTALLDARVLALGVLMAVFASVIPYSFELRALERLPKRTFSILVSLEPAIGALVGAVLLDQRLAPLSWVGVGCVVVAGIGATATAPGEQTALLPESA